MRSYTSHGFIGGLVSKASYGLRFVYEARAYLRVCKF